MIRRDIDKETTASYGEQHDQAVTMPVCPTFPTEGYVRLSSIIAPKGPIPVSRSGFYAKVREGIYPKPFKASARVACWKAQDILALIARIERGELS